MTRLLPARAALLLTALFSSLSVLLAPPADAAPVFLPQEPVRQLAGRVIDAFSGSPIGGAVRPFCLSPC